MERIRQVQHSASRSVRYDGADETDKVVALGGLGPLAEYADCLGLTSGMATAVPYSGPGIPVVDRGGLLVHSLLMLNAGGDCCTDLGMLQAAGGVLGDVGSDTTFRRMIADLAKTPGSTGAIDEVMREIRTRVWAEHGWSDPGRRVLLDIDATLTRVHSEKEDAKGNYKRGFGFHPVACFADCSGEALAVEHRPGNAGANTIADLVGIIDAGLDALPESVAQSHRPGAVTADATSEILVRSDSAGHTLGFLWDMWDRNLRFCVTGRSNNILSSVILGFDENTNWENALRPRGVDWDGNDSDVDARKAQVVEVTDDPAITKWVGLNERPKDDLDVRYPPGTRIVIRREPLHPGAQQRMFDTNGWRHTIIICDLPDDSPAEIDRLQREHAHVEENIKRLKTTGLDRFPFPDTARNKVWTAMVGWAHTLCRWFLLDLLAGTEFEHAHPKKLRRCLFGTPAILRVRNRQTWTLWPKHWPWNPQLRTAGRRLRTMNTPTPLRV